jgi:tetratricopeptide (TPR) repeat protein
MFRNESFFVKCLWRTVTAAVLATGLAGCEPAPQSQKTPAAGKSTSRPTSKAHLPPLTARSLQTLDQLQPPVSRPTNKPYTRKLPASAKRTLAQARELLKKEDYPGAIDKLERALGFDPKNPHVRRLLGLTYMQLPNYGKAAANLREAEKYLGDDVVLQLLLGRLAMQQNQIDTALLHCRKALKCSNANPADSKTAGALLLTAQLLDRQGHWTAALEAYEKLEGWTARHGQAYQSTAALRKLKPRDLIVIRGRLLYLLRQRDEAARLLGKLLQENPGDAEAGRLLVTLLAADGKPSRALDMLVDLVAANARNVDVVPGSVDEIILSRPPAGLLRSFSKSAYSAAAAKKFARHYVAGVFTQKSGKELLAADHFQQAIDAKSDFFPAYEALLTLYIKAGREEDATRLLNKCRKAAPKSYIYYYLLGRMNLAAGKLDQAIDALTASRKKNASHLPTMLALAEAYRIQARRGGRSRQAQVFWRQSESLLRTSLTKAPMRVDIYRMLFDQFSRCGEFDKALKLATDLTRELPQNPAGPIMAAKTHLMMNQQKKAQALIVQLARQFPDYMQVPLLAIHADLAPYPNVVPKPVFDRSVVRLQQILKRQPTNETAQRILAGLLGRPVPGEYADAAVIWGRLYKQKGSCPQIGRAYTLALVRAKQLPLAAKILAELLQHSPKDHKLRTLLAEVLAEQERFDEAIEKVALWRKAEDRRALLQMLLDLYTKAEKYDAAIKMLDAELGRSGSPHSAINLRRYKLDMLLAAKRFDDAIALARKIGAVSPSTPNYWLIIVTHKMIDAGKFASAYRLLDAELKKKTSHIDYKIALYQLKISALVKQGKRDQALALAQKLIAESPEDIRFRQLLLGLYLEVEQYDRAVKQTQDWLEKFAREKTLSTEQRKIVESLRDLEISLLIQSGKLSHADKKLKAYLADDPNEAQLHNLRATLLSEMGKPAEAIVELERALKLQPKSAEYQNNLAYNLAETGKQLNRAETLSKTALRKNGFIISFMDTLAWIYYKKGQFERAADIFLSILPKEPEKQKENQPPRPEMHPVLWDHAGDVFYRLGWKQLAKRYWKVALVEAKKKTQSSREVILLRKTAAEKIRAVEENRPAKVAPLGQVAKKKARSKRQKKVQ